MVRKKVDNRIRVMIENGVKLGHRRLFVLVGDKGRDQVVILHHMLSKAEVKSRPTVLWCYKKELGFSSHRKKRMRQFQKKVRSGKMDVNEEDPFELFVASTNIRYCYYSETHKILGNTFGMAVLQDFEALTPNLLARTIETVEGGGIIVLLLRTITSMKQLFAMSMDVHARFRTEAHQDVVGRFNERFILSLGSGDHCIVMDDSLNILPISSNVANIVAVDPSLSTVSEEDTELKALKESFADTKPVDVLIGCCKTFDQAKALVKFIDVISEKSLDSTVSLTAGRGRGKSAALGLSIAAAIAFGYSNIYVTSPSPENLNTLFQFVFKGFDVLEYQEHIDYSITQSTNPEFNKAVVNVSFFRDHRQSIQYISPSDAGKLGQAELLVIDEAAAIPLPLVKSLLGPYLIFMASTINGYEGTGRSLSLKLIQQLRFQGTRAVKSEDSKKSSKVSGRVLHELTLSESIRYKPGDPVEKWLTDLLCLDATLTPSLSTGCPPPGDCELYYINRDTLFCYHKASEVFLQQIMSLYVASHYKNSPNDLQMLSDAPAHHLFCLLAPSTAEKKSLPDVLVVLQVCLEGKLSQNSVTSGLTRGKRASGDLIPWTMAQQFQDDNFPSLCGARIVRIATHPDYQGMGYGSRALDLLEKYYEHKLVNLEEMSTKDASMEMEPISDAEVNLLTETVGPRKNIPPLLLRLEERPPENLTYLGVSFGLTADLLKFWKRAGYIPTYLRQTSNELTGEHSCIMLKILGTTHNADNAWLKQYWSDFRRRFISLLGFQFRQFSTMLGLTVLLHKGMEAEKLDSEEFIRHCRISPYDLKRLEVYTKNMADYHLIVDLIPELSRMFFENRLGSINLSPVQSAVMLGMGLQHKTIDEISKELQLPGTQLLGLFNRTIKKFVDFLNEVGEKRLSKQLNIGSGSMNKEMNPVCVSLHEELETAALELKKKATAELKELKASMKDDLQQYAIKGSDEQWSKALDSSVNKAMVSINVGQKRTAEKSQNSGKKMKPEDDFGKGWKKPHKNKNKKNKMK